MIRFAQEKDLKEIAEIHLHNRKAAYQGIMNERYLNGLTQESVYEQWVIYYSKADRKILVYDLGGIVAGFSGVRFFNGKMNCGLLDYFHTKEEYRHRGIGRALWTASCSLLLSEGIQNMELFCVEGNDSAKKFYENIGATFNGFKIRTYTSTETIDNRYIINNIDKVCPEKERGKYNLNNNYDLLLQSINKDFVLFGAGGYAEEFFDQFGKDYKPKMIFENNERLYHLRINGVEIVAPRLTDYNVVVASPYTTDIKEQLQEMGYQQIEFFCPWHQYLPL